ncbi:hypothetical protein ACJMK2_013115 [Sinanodonta woodiana]|uniref:Uncharacterized protein n=1 Tax=Sinanodonta woodiana TaxID=1069815 RepID=A0ABD3VAB8_SINWO
MKKRSYRTNQAKASTTSADITNINELPCSNFTYNAAATQSSNYKSDIKGAKKPNRFSILLSECKREKEIISVDIKQKYNTTKPNGEKGNKKNKKCNKTIAFTRSFFIITVVLFLKFLPTLGSLLCTFS